MSRRNREEMAQQAAMQASEAGRVLQAQRTQSEPEPAPEPAAESDRPTPKPRNEPRDNAFAEIEAREAKQRGTPEPEVETTPAVEAAQPAAEVTPEVTPEVTEPPKIETVRVKVDGEEFDVPKAEVEDAGGIRAFQREKAAENRLKKAGEALAETRRAQAEFLAFVQKQTQPQDKTPTTDELIASKIDVIRFGSPEESAAALRQVLEQSNPRVDQDQLTERAVAKMQQSLAVQAFQTEFADVVANPLLLKLAATLEQERTASAKGPIDYGHLYRSIGNELRSVIGRPSQPEVTSPTTGTPSQVSSDKEARKASIVNLPTAAARAAPPAESKPETREDTLAEMRRARGIPNG